MIGGGIGNGERREMTGNETRQAGSAFWLISRIDGDGHEEMLSVERNGEDALVVFGFEEEAWLFLRFEDLGDGWRLVASAAEELLSLLEGSHASVGQVALDPLPRSVAGAMYGLSYLDRRRFVDRLSGRTNPGGGDGRS